MPSEVTVSIESEKGNVKTQQEELKPNGEGKIGKGGGNETRVELDTWCKNQNTNFFSLNANQKGGKGEEKECNSVKTVLYLVPSDQ